MIDWSSDVCSSVRRRDHDLDGRLDLGLVAARRQSENRITHQCRRLSGVETYDRLALGCATDILNAATGRLSEFVDVVPRTWASRFRRDGGYDLRVMYGGNRRDRCDNRNRCLTTAGEIGRAHV